MLTIEKELKVINRLADILPDSSIVVALSLNHDIIKHTSRVVVLQDVVCLISMVEGAISRLPKSMQQLQMKPCVQEEAP